MQAKEADDDGKWKRTNQVVRLRSTRVIGHYNRNQKCIYFEGNGRRLPPSINLLARAKQRRWTHRYEGVHAELFSQLNEHVVTEAKTIFFFSVTAATRILVYLWSARAHHNRENVGPDRERESIVLKFINESSVSFQRTRTESIHNYLHKTMNWARGDDVRTADVQ